MWYFSNLDEHHDTSQRGVSRPGVLENAVLEILLPLDLTCHSVLRSLSDLSFPSIATPSTLDPPGWAAQVRLFNLDSILYTTHPPPHPYQCNSSLHF